MWFLEDLEDWYEDKEFNDKNEKELKEWIVKECKTMLFRVYKNKEDGEYYSVNGVGYDKTNNCLVVIYFKGYTFLDIQMVLVMEFNEFKRKFEKTDKNLNMDMTSLLAGE